MDVAALATSVVQTRIVSYTNVASMAILTYDWLLTLDGEIRSIWLSRWNFTKFLYVLTRYSSFIECAVVAVQLSLPGDNYYGCALVFKLNVWLYVFGLGTGEAIMTLRTWAVWEKRRVLTYFLFGSLAIVWSSGFVIAGLFNNTVLFEPNPRTPYIGCYATHTDPIIFICWVLLLAFDLFVFILMAIPAVKTWRTGRGSRLINLVLRDGVLYYFYLFVVSLINILVALTFPPDLLLTFTLMSRAIHCILACRVMLHIDNHVRKTHNPSQWEISDSHGSGPSGELHKLRNV